RCKGATCRCQVHPPPSTLHPAPCTLHPAPCTQHLALCTLHRPFSYNPFVRLTSSAPTRIDLAGGTIDIWPLYIFHEGASTLNAAISLRAHVDIESRTDGRVELRSIDTNRRIDAARWSDLDGAGDLTLLSLIARHYRVENMTVTTRGE